MPRVRDAAAARFAKRKKALAKKAHELVTRCDVEVAMFGMYPGDPFYWPSKDAAVATARRYTALPREDRERHLVDGVDLTERQLEEELDKLVRAQESGVAGALGSWDGSLEGMSMEDLRGLLRSIDGSLAAAGRSKGALDLEQQPQSGGAPDRGSIAPGPAPADEVMEETSVSVTGEARADGDVSAPPQEENPTKSPNAAPFVADEVVAENSEPATAGGVGNGVRLSKVDAGGDPLELPHQEEETGAANAAPLDADDAAEGQDESDDVQIQQPPADADADDAEWMRDLVDALKEIPPPSSAASYSSETEYVYLGRGCAMERDAYDFICFDLGMPPPYIEPYSPDSDDGEPIQLWSWE